MSHISHVRFDVDRCEIPWALVPATYRLNTRRYLYFIDRSGSNPELNLRDLVLLPCRPDEVRHLFSITLGLRNAPGATAAGTEVMREFGLSLRFEQAYDGRAGDIGSKVCAVVFPRGTTPRDFDDFVAEWVSTGRPGSQLIRKASETKVRIQAKYSSDSDLYFGEYASIWRYLPLDAGVTEIDRITIQPDTGMDRPGMLVLQLTESQREAIEERLSDVYGQGRQLKGQFAHVSYDANFEALSFSLLDPDDILCWIDIGFAGRTREVNSVVTFLGERGVDFRQYNIVWSENGYEMKLLCDLSQSDFHLFNEATLREMLAAELEAVLVPPAGGPTQFRSVHVTYEHRDLTLWGSFTARDRFHLLAVAVLNNEGGVIAVWQAADITGLPADIAAFAATAGDEPSEAKVEDAPSRSVLTCRHECAEAVFVAVYDNVAPSSFARKFRHLSRQDVPRDAASLEKSVHRILLRELRYDHIIARETFDALSDREGDAFRRESDIRFSTLGWKYIQEKFRRDKFAFQGNVEMAKMVGDYLANRPEIKRRLARGERLRMLDIGPAVGALTTALIVRRNPILWEHLGDIELVLMDVSAGVLEQTADASGYDELPIDLLDALQLGDDEDRARFTEFLRHARYLLADASDPALPQVLLDGDPLGHFDLVYSGFCHHHMNRVMKAAACRTMLDLANVGAFVGLVDESLTYKQFLLYRVGHSLDEVGIATESYFQSLQEHADLFDERLRIQGRLERGGNNFYAFWGETVLVEPEPVVPENPKPADVVEMLRKLERISLTECVVVGRYLRYEPRVRNALKRRVRQIQAPLRKKTKNRENFLIWAAPGSGKTFLIQQTAAFVNEVVPGGVEYVECNLISDTREEFEAKVRALSRGTRPVLCLLDEIDARPDESWPYEACYEALDLNTKLERQVVVALIGSTQANVEAMARAMKPRKKGDDVLTRVFPQNWFEIPAATPLDSTAMVIGDVVNTLGERVRGVEKLALFYVITQMKGVPRQVSELVRRAAERFEASDDVLRYYHLFDPADPAAFDFKAEYGELLTDIENVYVQIAH
jgi:hypothetical protein